MICGSSCWESPCASIRCFWVVSALFGSQLPPKYVILWVAVVFVSILVHEFGHALTMRAFGSYPQVLLYSFGGLAMSMGQRRQSPGRQLLISLAGPAPGFYSALSFCSCCARRIMK